MQTLGQIITTLTAMVMVLSAQVGNLNQQAAVVTYPSGAHSLFTNQTPILPSNSDGATTNYELGMKFQTDTAGQIVGVRFYKTSNESGTHTGRIWSASGSQLASVVFTSETASGWQEQLLATPLNITANTTYVVTVNTGNSYYVATDNGLQSQVTNGDLLSVVGSNGVYGSVGQFPTQTYQTSNYFRDIIFVPGTITPPLTSPSISSFSASPSSITSGNSSTLSWSVSGNPIPTLSISNIGVVTGLSINVSPTQTTSYTLTTTNSQGTATANTTITVSTTPPTDTTAPSIPQNLSATTVSSSQINLMWVASTDNIGVIGYDIYRGGILLTSVIGTSYSNTGLSPLTLHSYTVRAKDAVGNVSAQSSSASATTQAIQTGSNINCDATTLQTAISNAVSGAVITCNTGNWSGNISIPSTKGVTVNGNGSTHSGTFNLDSNSIVSSRITNFIFTSGTGIMNIRGGDPTSAPWRVDHNTFTGNGHTMIHFGTAPGLFDHNTFTSLAAANEFIHNEAYGAGNTAGWTNALTPGSYQAVYLEDNSFTTPTSQSNNAWIQSYYGARMVYRYNTFNYTRVDAHGTAGNVGARWWEFYKNNFVQTGGNAGGSVVNNRAGSGIVFDNTKSGSLLTGDIGLCEEDSGYPASYQVGRGQNQTLYPAYAWGNAIPVNVDSCEAPEVSGMVQFNRDIYRDTGASCVSGGSCTSGVGIGTLLPTTCTTNTGFWKTDAGGNWNGTNGTSNDGALYKCTSTNNWTLYYTPFTYPYPLDTNGLPNPSGGSNPPLPPSTYTLTVSKSGNGSGTVTGSSINCGVNCSQANITSGSQITLFASASSGSSFVGWSGGGCSGTGSCTVMVSSNTTITATFNTSVVVGGTTHWVSPTGTASWNSCASQTALSGASACSFSTMSSNFSGGDTVYFRAGTYNLSGYFIIRAKSGTLATPTTFKNYSGENVILRGPGYSSGSLYIDNSDYVTIDGLKITNTNQGIFVEGDSDNVIIKNCEVYDLGQDAVHFRGGSDNFLVENCSVHDTGRLNTNEEAFYVGTGENDVTPDYIGFGTIRNNTIYNISGGEAVELKPGAHDMIIEGNNIYNISNVSDYSGIGAIEIFGNLGNAQTWPANPNHIIRNNIIHDSTTAINAGTGATIYNNLIYDIVPGNWSSDYAVRIENDNNDNYVRKIYHNTIDMPSTKVIYNIGGQTDIKNNIGPATTNNLAFSSSYVMSAIDGSENYHLVSSATPINVGANVGITTDLDGNNRPSGASYDYGAYEYTGSTSPVNSTKFIVGQRVQTTSNLNVRSTASATGTLLGNQSLGSLGTIISGGQSADSYFWWNVNYDNAPDGYSVENYLTPYSAPIVGDFNFDGLVNSIDLSLLTSAWNTSNATYDLNSDSTVNSLDYAIMVQNWSL